MLTVEEQVGLIADAAMNALDLDTAAAHRAPPRETVLDRMSDPDTSSPVQFTAEVATMIDVSTADPIEPRQKRPRRAVITGILAAAAVVAIVAVASSDVDVVAPADDLSTTVPASPLPRALPNKGGDRLVPGTYFVDQVDGTPTARIAFTIGTGWSYGSGSIWQNDIGYISFSRADRVFSDACRWTDGYHPGPVTTLDGVVAGLIDQGGWADVTISDISVDGYAGKAFQRTAPADLSDCSTMPLNWSPHIHPPNRGVSPLPVLRSWQYGTEESGSGGDLYEPGEVETLWVLDLDGTVVIINTRLWPSVTTDYRAMAGPSEAARADFAAVLDSIRIDDVAPSPAEVPPVAPTTRRRVPMGAGRPAGRSDR